MTTPNVEYNVRYEGARAGHVRHHDHRFEWNRAEFAAWAGGVAAAHGYTVDAVRRRRGRPDVGRPTQMAVFTR